MTSLTSDQIPGTVINLDDRNEQCLLALALLAKDICRPSITLAGEDPAPSVMQLAERIEKATTAVWQMLGPLRGLFLAVSLLAEQEGTAVTFQRLKEARDLLRKAPNRDPARPLVLEDLLEGEKFLHAFELFIKAMPWLTVPKKSPSS